MKDWHQDQVLSQVLAQLSALTEAVRSLEQRVERFQRESREAVLAGLLDSDLEHLVLRVNEDRQVWEHGVASLTLSRADRNIVNTGRPVCFRVDGTAEDLETCRLLWEFNLPVPGHLSVFVIYLDDISAGHGRDLWGLCLYEGPLSRVSWQPHR